MVIDRSSICVLILSFILAACDTSADQCDPTSNDAGRDTGAAGDDDAQVDAGESDASMPATKSAAVVGVCNPTDLGSAIGSAVAEGRTEGNSNDFAAACGAGASGPDIAFRWLAPEDGTYRFDTRGSSFDTVLHAYSACGSESVACDDDGLEDRLSSLELSLTRDEEVILVVDGFGTEAGDFQLNIENREADLPIRPDVSFDALVPPVAGPFPFEVDAVELGENDSGLFAVPLAGDSRIAIRSVSRMPTIVRLYRSFEDFARGNALEPAARSSEASGDQLLWVHEYEIAEDGVYYVWARNLPWTDQGTTTFDPWARQIGFGFRCLRGECDLDPPERTESFEEFIEWSRDRWYTSWIYVREFDFGLPRERAFPEDDAVAALVDEINEEAGTAWTSVPAQTLRGTWRGGTPRGFALVSALVDEARPAETALLYTYLDEDMTVVSHRLIEVP